MLDLETLSTRKNAAIVQIAAIAFDPRDGRIESINTGRPRAFNAFVIDREGHIDPKTVAWWMQQKPAASLGKKIETTGVLLDEALRDLKDWYEEQDAEAVWSHGATFDIAIIEQRCAEIGRPVPWHYRHPRDTRTLFALAPGGMPAVPGNPELTHDALYDCEIQIKQVVGALAALRGAMLAAGVAA
jgi:exodeoxyribonuclease VIII